jgi:PPOX class probable F420-dependent enzyme
MPAGTCRRLEDLPPSARSILEDARRAVLATVDAGGAPHAVPITFAVVAGNIVTAVDDKPKSGRELRRLRNIRSDPAVTVLADRWSEQWEQLGWIMIVGRARIEPPGTEIEHLVARYPQYEARPPSGEVVVIAPELVRWWLYSDS